MKQKNILICIGMLALLAAGMILTGCGSGNSSINSNSYSFNSAAPKFAVVGNINCTNVVSVFSVNASTGALTELAAPASPVTVNAQCPIVSVHPNGKWIYVTDTDSPSVQAFSIDNSGNLAPIGNLAYNSGDSYFPAFSSDGKYLFTADDNPFVSPFNIDSTTGALTALGSVSSVSLTSTYRPDLVPSAVAGSYLYTGDRVNQPTVFGFTVTSGGTPVSITGSPWSVPGREIYALAADRSGTFIYASNGNGEIYGYRINSGGSLSALAGFPVYLPNSYVLRMVFEPRNKFLYISDYSNGVWGYSFNSTTGALTKITGSPFAAGSCTWGLTVDPSAAFLYAANYCSSNITGYTIDQNTGALTPMGSSFAPSNMNDNNSIAITH